MTFSHGWPLSSAAWDVQMLFLVQNGFRVVAHDRRGHGRSSQASTGNDMDGYTDDLAAVLNTLDCGVCRPGLKNSYESIEALSGTDLTDDLKKFDIPTLVMHGEDDQIVPVKDSAPKQARLISGAREIYYPGAPDGSTATRQDRINADLLAFIQGA